jgi:hypothetical protein
MTIYNKSVLVDKPNIYNVDNGVDIVWKNTLDGTAATLIAEDKSMINNQLSKLKLIQDSIKSWRTYRDLPKYPLKTILREDGKIERG